MDRKEVFANCSLVDTELSLARSQTLWKPLPSQSILFLIKISASLIVDDV